MKHVVILECDKCGKTVELPGDVLQYLDAKRDDPYWGYAPAERAADIKYEAAREQLKKWDVRPESRFELCPECKQKRWDFINQAKDKAEREFWEEEGSDGV